MLLFFSAVWMQDSKRAEKGTGSGCGWVLFVWAACCWGSDSDTESRHEHGNVSVERDVHGICWRRVSESGQKEEGNCDGRDVESRLFFCDLAYKSSEVCVIAFLLN